MRNVTMPASASVFKRETQQSVKRDKRKGEHGVKTESANAFSRKHLETKT